MPLRCRVYIDGFNLYYGALKGTPYKWVNLRKMCEQLAPKDATIDRIKYFTAKIVPRPSDPDQGVRQQLLFRALKTLPGFEIILGKFYSHDVTMRLSNPLPGQNPFVTVIKTEEKGSDVNLATHLLVDGFQDKYDIALVVTNDTDLLGPMRVVRAELGKQIGLLNPQQRPSKTLQHAVNFMKPIRAGLLGSCLFPDTMSDAVGTFTKPAGW
jgi:uncharacterized LabA/DUF88 family protein